MRKFIFALIALCGLATAAQACDYGFGFSFRGGCIPSQQVLVQQPVLTYQPVLIQQPLLLQQDVYSFRSFGVSGCNSTFGFRGVDTFDFGARVRVRAPGVRVRVGW